MRRVEIPKPKGRGVRLLGIPTVLDRVVRQAIAQVLTPLFDPAFSESSFRFRPGRSAHGALRQVQRHIGARNNILLDDLDGVNSNAVDTATPNLDRVLRLSVNRRILRPVSLSGPSVVRPDPTKTVIGYCVAPTKSTPVDRPRKSTNKTIEPSFLRR